VATLVSELLYRVTLLYFTLRTCGLLTRRHGEVDATERVSGAIGTEADVDAGVGVSDPSNGELVEVGAVLACDGRRHHPAVICGVSRHHDEPLTVEVDRRHVVSSAVLVDAPQPLDTRRPDRHLLPARLYASAVLAIQIQI